MFFPVRRIWFSVTEAVPERSLDPVGSSCGPLAQHKGSIQMERDGKGSVSVENRSDDFLKTPVTPVKRIPVMVLYQPVIKHSN